ncbi:FtsX-like permease family protein [bacterium]|nr:FtsX-like permease family protein [bacterium]
MLFAEAKMMLRILWRHKFYSAISIVGLALGIASSLLIYLYARGELTWDAFHTNADRIYMMSKERKTATGLQMLDDIWLPVKSELEQQYAGIEEVTRVWTEQFWLEYEGTKTQERFHVADANFFEVFSFPLQHGDASTALQDPQSIVLSAELANRLFGRENPIGRMVRLGHRDEYEVKGVMEPVPYNASLAPNAIIPLMSITDEEARNNWDSSWAEMYLLLQPGTDADALQASFPELIERIFGKEGENGSERMRFVLTNLLDLHHRDTNAHTWAYSLLAISLGIIIIASINYMNIATARAMERAREIGVRKVLGAARTMLVRQLLAEALVLTAVAVLLGVGLAELMLPILNNLFETELSFGYGSTARPWLILVGLWLGVGLLSGLYPAFYISAFRPIATLAGRWQHRREGVGLRNVLVTVQFALSIGLVIVSGVIWHQLNYLKHRDPGFERDNVIVVPVNIRDFADRADGAMRINRFAQALRNRTDILSVSQSMSVPGYQINANVFARPEGWTGEFPLRVMYTMVDTPFVETYDMRFVEGGNFTYQPKEMQFPPEEVIVNEAMIEAIGWETAVGKTFVWGEQYSTIVGVVEDYTYGNMRNEIRPMIHVPSPPEHSRAFFVSARIKGGNIPETLDAVETLWGELDPTREFDYFFVDERLDRLYRAEDRLGTVATAFAILAVVIAMLGLLGLSSYTIAQKTKEIGIRKVLGATVAGITTLLTRRVVLLMLIGYAVAAPAAWWLMQRWLEEFTVRAPMPVWVFIGAGLLGIALAALVVGGQAVRAASGNPAHALRYE